jgi:hypothetical protein
MPQLSGNEPILGLNIDNPGPVPLSQLTDGQFSPVNNWH